MYKFDTMNEIDINGLKEFYDSFVDHDSWPEFSVWLFDMKSMGVLTVLR